MRIDDDDLKRDLTEAAGRDLPGAEFDEAVLDAIRGGGGERAISAEVPESRRRRVFGLLAAAVLGGLLVWGVASGLLHRSGESPDTAEELAGPGVKLPPAETSLPFPRPLKIVVTKDEVVHVVGRTVDFADLRRFLVNATRGTHSGAWAPSSRDVVIQADRRVRWRVIQWVMQTCADPDVRLNRIYWAVSGAEEKRVLPVFLPVDRGLDGRDGSAAVGIGGGAGGAFGGRGGRARLKADLVEEEIVEEPEPEDGISDEPFVRGPDGRVGLAARARISIELAREEDESEVRVRVLDDWLGEGEDGFSSLKARVALIFQYEPSLPAEVNAGAHVPFEDVVRAVDICRKAGVSEITFVGAPPPVHGK